MDFKLNDEQQMVRETIREFAEAEIKPGVMERDEKAQFPAEVIKKLGELGFMGMQVPEQYGGTEMDALSYVITLEEVARVDASTCVIMSVNNSLFSNPILKFGSEYLKTTYLPLTSSGEKLGAYSLSEPQSGSDAKAMLCSATKDGASGVDMGRNIFQSDNPLGMIKAVKAIVHENATLAEALDIYRTPHEGSRILQ